MPFSWAECQWCHSKQRSYFTEGELSQMRGGKPHYRMCAFCQVATQWLRVEPLAPPAEQPLPATAIKLDAPTVLVIDDDEDILAVLRKVLVGQSFHVEAADSARGALSKMVNETFDAIISDIHMPGFDGKKMFLFIAEYMPEYRQRVMFLTGDTESPDTQTFLQQSGCPYTYKPIDFEQLLGKINQLLAAQQLPPAPSPPSA